MIVINKVLESYLPLMDFLGDVLGENYEIVMHDLTVVDNSVVAIKNGYISNRTVGAPATSLAMSFINEKVYEKSDYVLNYKGKGKDGKNLKSSTFFIKDTDENVVGMLCINIDIENYVKLNNMLQKIIGVEADTNNVTEEFRNSLDEIASDYIAQSISEFGIDPERMSVDEKIEIIKGLYDKGAFSYKGMVVNVANELKVSEPTVYRYLNKIKNVN